MADKEPAGVGGGHTQQVMICHVKLHSLCQVYTICGLRRQISPGFLLAQLSGNLKGYCDQTTGFYCLAVVATLNWKVLFIFFF